MRLAEPHQLWLLLALVPLAVILLLLSKPERLRVSALWHWPQINGEQATRLTWRPRRTSLGLLFAAAAVALAALAAAHPLTATAPSPVTYLALVIDVSASMNSREGSTPRIETAKKHAAATIDRLHPDARVLVIAAGRHVSTHGFQSRAQSALSVAELRALDVGDDLPTALAFAADQLRNKAGDRRIVLITDGVLSSVNPFQQLSIPVEIQQIGTRVDNVAILRAVIESHNQASDQAATLSQARAPVVPNAEDPGIVVRVQLVVRNYDSDRRQVHLSLAQRNVTGLLTSVSQVLEAQEEATIQLEVPMARSDAQSGLWAELSPADALPSDNRAYLVVPDTASQSVWLTPPGQEPWLTKALEADPALHVEETSDSEALEALSDDRALVVFSGRCPRRTPRSDFLVVAPPAGPCLSFVVGPEVADLEITDWDDSDARLRFLNLAQLEVSRARPLSSRDSTNFDLLRSRAGTLIGSLTSRGRYGTVLGFELGKSNWPSSAAFVVFVRNVVEFTRARQLSARRTGFPTDSVVELWVPTTTSQVTAILPDASQLSIAASEGSLRLPSTSQAGFYFVSWKEPPAGSHLLSLNLENARESNPEQQQLPLRLDAHGPLRPAQRPAQDLSWLCAVFAAIAAVGASLWFMPAARKAET